MPPQRFWGRFDRIAVTSGYAVYIMAFENLYFPGRLATYITDMFKSALDSTIQGTSSSDGLKGNQNKFQGMP
jgi:hypothetical protein